MFSRVVALLTIVALTWGLVSLNQTLAETRAALSAARISQGSLTQVQKDEVALEWWFGEGHSPATLKKRICGK